MKTTMKFTTFLCRSQFFTRLAMLHLKYRMPPIKVTLN